MVIGGMEQQRQKFQIDRPQAFLSLNAAYSDSKSSSSGGTEVRTTETVYQEILGLTTRAWILSPNFIDMNLAGSFGLQQTAIDSNASTLEGESGKGDEETYEYDATATFLRLSTAPLTLFARRTQDIVTQPFGSSYESTADTMGGSWQIRHKTLPTSLRYQHLNLQQTTLGGDLDFESTEDIFAWNTSWRPTDKQVLNWSYEYRTSQWNDEFGDSEEDSHDALLDHTLNFGRDARSELESTLQYYTQTGDTNYDRARWAERLRLRHSDQFETRYNYDFSQFTYEGSETTSHRASTGFTHWLYSSLITSGSFAYVLSDSDGSETSEWIANLTLDYRKKVPLGTFFSTFTATYSSQESEARGDPLIFLDQSYSFEGFQPLLIPQQNIVPSSIVVSQRRPGGEEVFVQGIDYTVTPVPAGVEIRPVGANITVGQPVLVDYTLAPQGASEITTSSFGITGRYTLEEGWLRGLSPYARYFVQQQDVSTTGINPPLPNDITSYTFGSDYRIGHFLFRAEHQIVDSTLLPFEATRFRAEWTQDLMIDLRAGANIEHTILEYTDTGSQTDATSVSATIDYRLTRFLTAMGRVSWIMQTDSVSGDTEGWDSELGLRWRYRQTQIHGSVRQTSLSTEDFDTESLLFQLGFERRF